MRALRTKALEQSREDLRARAWSCWPEERDEEAEEDLRAATREYSMGFDGAKDDEENDVKGLLVLERKEREREASPFVGALNIRLVLFFF